MATRPVRCDSSATRPATQPAASGARRQCTVTAGPFASTRTPSGAPSRSRSAASPTTGQPRGDPPVGMDTSVRIGRLHAVEPDEVQGRRGRLARPVGLRHGQQFGQERRRPAGHHAHHGEPSGQSGEQPGDAVQRTGGGGVLHDRGERPVEVAEERRAGRFPDEGGEQGLGAGRQAAGRALVGSPGGAQVPVCVVVVVADADFARSGATTTRTSAVPIVLTGAAVVYGRTADAGRCRVAATASAAAFCPDT